MDFITIHCFCYKIKTIWCSHTALDGGPATFFDFTIDASRVILNISVQNGCILNVGIWIVAIDGSI